MQEDIERLNKQLQKDLIQHKILQKEEQKCIDDELSEKI